MKSPRNPLRMDFRTIPDAGHVAAEVCFYLASAILTRAETGTHGLLRQKKRKHPHNRAEQRLGRKKISDPSVLLLPLRFSNKERTFLWFSRIVPASFFPKILPELLMPSRAQAAKNVELIYLIQW